MGKTDLIIDTSTLKGKSVMIATPMYGGMGNTMYISSLLQLKDKFNHFGIRMEHAFMMNESLIDRARNGLSHEFLTKSTADYMLFIDADIGFNADDILAMLSFDKDIICAPYPKKHINWPMITQAVKIGVEDPAVLEKLVGEYVFTPLEEDSKLETTIKVSEAGTGLMLIKRQVFTKMMEAIPDGFYYSDHSFDLHAGIEKKMFAFFRTGIFENRYLSEDYYFCRKWRELGGDVWLFPWVTNTHFGTYGFTGSLSTFIDTAIKIQAAQGNANEKP